MSTEPTPGEDREDSEAGQTRPFADILLALNRGKSHADMSRLMQQLVGAVTATGKKGTLTIQISVAPTKSDGVLEVVDTISLKAPSATRAASMFFADDEFNLVREDPRQFSLPGMRDLTADPADRAPLRKAD